MMKNIGKKKHIKKLPGFPRGLPARDSQIKTYSFSLPAASPVPAFVSRLLQHPMEKSQAPVRLQRSILLQDMHVPPHSGGLQSTNGARRKETTTKQKEIMRDAMATRRRKTATTDTNGMKTNVSAGETKRRGGEKGGDGVKTDHHR